MAYDFAPLQRRTQDSERVCRVETAPTTGPSNSSQQDQLREQAISAVTTDVLGAVPSNYRDGAEVHVSAVVRELAASGLTNKNQVAYILATAEHESRWGSTLYGRSEPLVEDRNNISQRSNGTWGGTDHVRGRSISGNSLESAETDYWDSAYGGRLGNERGTTDAKNYRGRGYVQITGRENYQRMSGLLNAEGFSYTFDGQTYGGQGNPAIDLITHYEHVNQVPALAARLMVKGMTEGNYTGVSVGDYINESQTDMVNARRSVNGDTSTNGAKIAGIAQRYLGALGQWDALMNLGQVSRDTGEAAATGNSDLDAARACGTMRLGDQGDGVASLQRLLNEHGAGLDVNGQFDAATRRAVRSFQASNRLRVDGIAGAELIDTLAGAATARGRAAESLATSATQWTVPTPRPESPSEREAAAQLKQDKRLLRRGRTLRNGSTGQRVMALQRVLESLGHALTVDGDFGLGTYQAVQAFQRANGMRADGIAGAETLAALSR